MALNLVSVEPITVTHNGGQNPEQWNIAVGPSPTRPSQGQAQIIPVGEPGGLMNSQLRVFPLFTFTRLSDGTTKTLNASFLPPQQVNLQAQNVPWARGCQLPALAVPGLNDGFCPGLFVPGPPRKVPTIERALLAQHGIYPAQPAPEHYKCYKLKRKRFNKRDVTLSDQFGARQTQIKKRTELCNPVQKNDEPFRNKRAHGTCYSTRGPQAGKLVAVQNQFGSQRLLVQQPRRLCVPSEKRKITRRGRKPFKPIEVPTDHYQCYDVVPQTPLRRVGQLGTVRLKDQFGTENNVEVRDPRYLCAPVQKNQEPIQHPVKHYVCYRIKDEKVRKRVQVRNQFEQKAVRTKKPVSLCVPTNKVLVP